MRTTLTYLLFCVALLAWAPHRTQADQRAALDSLNNQLQAGELTGEEYLISVNRWMDQTFALGELFEKDTLIAMLETYRQLAWQDGSTSDHRINYYIHLNNNANYGNREGESIYFLEKAEQQIMELHGEKPLMVAGRKCNSYAANHNYRNVIASYEAEREYIETFPERLRDKSINLNIASGFINVLHPTVQAYAKLRDTAKVEETIQLAQRVHEAFAQHVSTKVYAGFTIHFYMQSIQSFKYFTLLRDEAGSERVLRDMHEALYGDTARYPALITTLRPVWLSRAVEHHLAFHNNDSAAHYLALLKESTSTHASEADNYRYESELLANQGQYQLAYEHAASALGKVDSIRSVLVNDIDELLYAHTAAEFANSALLESERTKRKQLYWIFAIVVVSIVLISSVYWVMRRKHLAARAQIDKLNDMAKFQITAMEEIRAEAIREEQKRLGRDLHDGLSATLAGLKHQLELLIVDNPDTAITNKLVGVRDHIDHAYTVSRKKSHEWFDTPEGLEETSFNERVRALLDSALPDGHFEKEVLIDSQALKNVAIEVRIELLRVVHEAITNVIKHAKAKWISVLLYEDQNMLKLAIDDDGRGIQPSQRRGLGIRSMQERIERFGGSLTVQPREKGTEVIASIPL